MDRNIASGTVELAKAATAPTTGTPGLFANPDPVAGINPTVCPPFLLNMIVEEIRNAVIRGGETPDRADWFQLADAITAIAQSVTGAAGPYVRQGGGAGQGGNLVYVGHSTLDSTKLKATVDSTDLGNFAFETWANDTFVPLINGMRVISGFGATTNWIVPPGVKAVQFGIVGGGGAGGNGVYKGYSGAGGGGGGACIGIASVQPGQTITITIGTPGQPSGAGSRGGDGGDTSFGSYGTASGGVGGGSNSPYSDGGVGGTGGLFNVVGGFISNGTDGTDGLAPEVVNALGGITFMAGNGGSSVWGGGGRGGNGGGLPGKYYGGGGGGAYGQTSAGGAGARGLAWVRY